jgi:hypothetical protein
VNINGTLQPISKINHFEQDNLSLRAGTAQGKKLLYLIWCGIL